MSWKVVPLSKGQLLDVRPDDVIERGLFRKCETYRGGGGYDKFPIRAESKWGVKHHLQFIVQLFGCHLDCPYCYVTREGVWGTPVKLTTKDLMESFLRSWRMHGTTVFHMMGGAPALQMKKWPEVIRKLEEYAGRFVFHSDLLLTEASYSAETLSQIWSPYALYAVDIKGLTQEEHLRNTRKPYNSRLLWHNLTLLERLDVPYYITFTNVAADNKLHFWIDFANEFPKSYHRRSMESFDIKLIDYKATAHVDNVSWGKQI